MFALCIILHTSGQISDENFVPEVIPPTPNAASLGKYVEVPVSLYTGIPQISVPIWEVKTRDISLPISLSYHSRGVVVDEVSSWVGTGWSLNAGGVISRTIRGKDDFNSGYGTDFDYINPNITIDLVYNRNNCTSEDGTERWQYVGEVMEGWRDVQPDVFFYNFNGYTGKFVFDQEGNVHLIPQEDIEIQYDGNFIVKTPDGFKYYFDQQETVQYYTHFYDTGPNSNLITNLSPVLVSSWYLTKIESPYHDELEIEYTDYNANSKHIFSNIDYYYGATLHCSNYYGQSEPTWLFYDHLTTTYNYQYRNETVPQYIKYNGKKLIEFIGTPYRCDLAQGKRLTDILIFNYDENLVKRFELIQNYSLWDQNPTNETCENLDTEPDNQIVDKRLWLHKVIEYDANENSKPPYVFDYYNGNLPYRFSNNIDYWGFYNGPKGNSTRIPEYTDENNYYYTGANRNPSLTDGRIGILNKTTYPTGGYTTYEYELNEFSNFLGHNFHTYDKEVELCLTEMGSYPVTKTFTVQSNTFFDIIYNGYVYESSTSCDPTYLYIKLENESGVQLNSCLINCPNCYQDFPFDISEIINNIEPGVYTITAYAHASLWPEPDKYPFMKIHWTETQPIELTSKSGGGMRVKKTIQYDGINHANDIIKYYKYNNIDNGEEVTSGLVMANPIHAIRGNIAKMCVTFVGPGHPHYTEQHDGNYLVRSSNSHIGLGSSVQGGYIGYSKVTVLYGDYGDGGKTEFYYSNNPDNYMTLIDGYIASVPNTSNSYKNGLIEKQISYKKNPEAYGNGKYIKLTNYSNTVEHQYLPSNDYILTYWNKGAGINVSGNGVTVIEHTVGTEQNLFGLKFHEVLFHVDPVTQGTLVLTGLYDELDDLKLSYTDGTIYAFTNFEDPDNHGGWVYSENHVEHYPEVDGLFTPMKELVNEYEFENKININGYVVVGYLDSWYETQNPSMGWDWSWVNQYIGTCLNISDYLYPNYSEWVRLANSVDIIYEECIPKFSKETTYTYRTDAVHHMPIEISESQSDGSLLIVSNLYPPDYDDGSSGTAAEAITLMKNDLHMFNKVIEKQVWIKMNETKKFLDGTITMYKQFYPNKVMAEKVMKLETTTPIIDFNPSTVENQFNYDDRYQEIVSFLYYDFGKLKQVNPHNDVVTSYLWGYNNMYPIAEAVNANFSEISFNTTTGERSCPEDAMMTTYTYDPVFGVICIDDPNEYKIYYEYDGFGRLKLIRDDDDNILEKYIYHYANEQ